MRFGGQIVKGRANYNDGIHRLWFRTLNSRDILHSCTPVDVSFVHSAEMRT
jgi:hypothetical protein